MRGFTILLCTLAVAACATRPAEVRVGFDSATIASIREAGFADRATKRRVTADDPVRVASVSKLVVALGVMRLVEAGTLDLDRDISDVLGWRFRNPAFPDAKISLRMLLSHTASLRDGVDYAIPLGGTLRTTLADPKVWNAGHAPGTYFSYANVNFPVVASVMEAATHERFDLLMQRLVFVPLGIDACFNWTSCSDDAVGRAAVLYDEHGGVRRDDLHGQRPACPVLGPDGCDLGIWAYGVNGALFSPQGGLRISARNLARIGQMMLKRGDGFLKPESIAALERPQWRFNGTNGDTENGFFCTYGLAMQTLAAAQTGCRDDPFGDGRHRTGHAGEAYGLRSGLWIDRASGTGVAFYATAVPDAAPKGRRSAFTAAEERMMRR